mmetsp:Transcript_3765/g.5764  ORF Transcript_3765/g.5764 Transcript_3765/m.5764 type:complete len:85 (+) Transcript_3765:281-535(+)
MQHNRKCIVYCSKNVFVELELGRKERVKIAASLPSYENMSRVLEVSRRALLRCVMLLFFQVVTEENQDYFEFLGYDIDTWSLLS